VATRLTVLPEMPEMPGARRSCRQLSSELPASKKKRTATGKKPARSSEEHVFPDFPHKFIAFQKHACGASVPSCNFGRRAIIANENFLVYRSLGTVEKL